MSIYRFRGWTQWALMVALVFGAGALALAQENSGDEATNDTQSEDRVIQIGPSDADDQAPETGESEAAQAAPSYWIGLLGGPVSEELLHHVAVPEGQGLLVRDVVPDSPAAKAGIQKWDIMVRANDIELKDMRDLVDLVVKAGSNEEPIAIEVMRHGSRETIHVTPENRPENVPLVGGNFGQEMGGQFPGFAPGQDPRALLEMFGRGMGPDGQAFEFRNFGQGANIPNGVSIQLHKEGDKPARVTVERDGKSWEVVANDPESLEKLPKDLRPFVDQMLHGGAINMPELNIPMPRPGEGFVVPQDLNKRLEEMERRLEEMQKHFSESQTPAEESR